MTLNLKEIITTYQDMLKPCPQCGSRRIVAEETIIRVTVFNYDDPLNTKNYVFGNPTLCHSFKCVKCNTIIYSRTTPLKEEKNYFEVLAKLFKDMEYSRIKARLRNTKQTTIKDSINKNG